ARDEAEPKRIKRIDASQNIEAIQQQLKHQLLPLLESTR
ncbi:MAG TPA: dTMP kinase, partial [Methylophaga sp.]|nr:dTMP kinase [Methylophaga sp.]